MKRSFLYWKQCSGISCKDNKPDRDETIAAIIRDRETLQPGNVITNDITINNDLSNTGY